MAERPGTNIPNLHRPDHQADQHLGHLRLQRVPEPELSIDYWDANRAATMCSKSAPTTAAREPTTLLKKSLRHRSARNVQIDSATFHIYTAHSYYPTTPTGVWLDTATSKWSPEIRSHGTTNLLPKTSHPPRPTKASGRPSMSPDTVKNWVNNPSEQLRLQTACQRQRQTYWKKFTSADNTSELSVPEITYRTRTPTAVKGAPTPTDQTATPATSTSDGTLSRTQRATKSGSSTAANTNRSTAGNVTNWSTQNKKHMADCGEIASGGYKLHQDSPEQNCQKTRRLSIAIQAAAPSGALTRTAPTTTSVSVPTAKVTATATCRSPLPQRSLPERRSWDGGLLDVCRRSTGTGQCDDRKLRVEPIGCLH